MLTIRLSRIGKKNKPMYRLTVSEKSKDLYGRSLEILGSYNPHTKELQAKADRINYWINNGAGTSPSVNNLLIKKGIIKGEKIKASKARTSKKGPKKQPTPEAKPEAAPVETSEKAKSEEPKEEIKKEVKPEETPPASE